MKNDSKAHLLVKNTSWIYIGKIISQILGLVVTIFVIRKLSVSVYGTFNFLVASVFIFSIFGLSPLVSVLNRYIPEFVANNDYIKLKKLILSSFFLSLIVLIILIILLITFKNFYGSFFHIKDFDLYLYPFVLFIIFSIQKVFFTTVLASLLLHKYISILEIFYSLFSMILYIIYLPVLNVNIMLNIGIILAILYVIGSFIVLYRYRKTISFDDYSSEHSFNKKRIARYGAFSLFNEIGAGVVGKSSDYFIISAIGSQYAVGLYAFAQKIQKVVFKIFPLKNFFTVIRPIFIQKFSKNLKRDEFIQTYNFMIKFMIPLFLFPILYFLIFGNEVITYIFDPKYLDSYWVTILVLFLGINIAIFYPIGLTIQLFEKMEYALYSKITVVFSIIAGIYLMKIWGIFGVALATLIGDLLKNLSMFFMIRKKAPIVYRFKEMINYLYISIFLGGSFYLINPLLTNVFKLIIFSVLFASIYLILNIMFHPYNAEDILLLNKIAGSSKITKKLKFIIINIYSIKLKFF